MCGITSVLSQWIDELPTLVPVPIQGQDNAGACVIGLPKLRHTFNHFHVANILCVRESFETLLLVWNGRFKHMPVESSICSRVRPDVSTPQR